MEYFIVFGLVYLFGCMVTAIVSAISYDANKDTKDEGEKYFVIDIICWPIIVPILCIKRIVKRIKNL